MAGYSLCAYAVAGGSDKHMRSPSCESSCVKDTKHRRTSSVPAEHWVAALPKGFKVSRFWCCASSHKCCDVWAACCRYRCMGPGYFWIRFGKGYDGYTATMAGESRNASSNSRVLRTDACCAAVGVVANLARGRFNCCGASSTTKASCCPHLQACSVLCSCSPPGCAHVGLSTTRCGTSLWSTCWSS